LTVGSPKRGSQRTSFSLQLVPLKTILMLSAPLSTHKVMGPPHHFAWEYVSLLANLQHLCPHHLMLGWILVSPLWLHEQGEGTSDVVRLAIPQPRLIQCPPVPEEGGQAVKPLKPGHVGNVPKHVVACSNCCESIWCGPYEKPLHFISSSTFLDQAKVIQASLPLMPMARRTICPGVHPLFILTLFVLHSRKPRRSCLRQRASPSV
jgi:hypothetical protein